MKTRSESFNRKKKGRGEKNRNTDNILFSLDNRCFESAVTMPLRVSLKRLSFNIQSIFFFRSNYFENNFDGETGNKNCDNSSVMQYFCNVVSPYSTTLPWLDDYSSSRQSILQRIFNVSDINIFVDTFLAHFHTDLY